MVVREVRKCSGEKSKTDAGSYFDRFENTRGHADLSEGLDSDKEALRPGIRNHNEIQSYLFQGYCPPR